MPPQEENPRPRTTDDVVAMLEPLRDKHLLVVASGSLTVSHLPFWVNWLRVAGIGSDNRIVLTRTAARFVSARALSAGLGRTVEADEWDTGDDDGPHALHVDLNAWADAVLVHPCTFSFMARLALGAGDSPAMLALQATRAPVVVCPAPPPGTLDSHAYRKHLDELESRPGVRVMDPVPARSTTTGEMDASAPASFPDAVLELAGMLDRAQRTQEPVAS